MLSFRCIARWVADGNKKQQINSTKGSFGNGWPFFIHVCRDPKMYIIAVKGQHFFIQTHLFACKGQRFLEKMASFKCKGQRFLKKVPDYKCKEMHFFKKMVLSTFNNILQSRYCFQGKSENRYKFSVSEITPFRHSNTLSSEHS